ncbi:MAG: hypothetical protein H0T69_03725 [Thermoleophilaceae bacterium]|nr:hypothetical protein [Thermoleophilaceae bacterium]
MRASQAITLNAYNPTNQPALRPPVEPAQYTSLAFGKTLTDAGVLEVELPAYQVTKGFLAQAKLIGDRRQVRKPKLLARCRDMLDLTPASYVFLYDPDAVRIVPALAVLANGGEPRNLHAWSVMEFFFEHFACFLG